jgi:hypothetical protein
LKALTLLVFGILCGGCWGVPAGEEIPPRSSYPMTGAQKIVPDTSPYSMTALAKAIMQQLKKHDMTKPKKPVKK